MYNVILCNSLVTAVWCQQYANGTPVMDKFEWTSINGKERQLVLQCLQPTIASLASGNASVFVAEY